MKIDVEMKSSDYRTFGGSFEISSTKFFLEGLHFEAKPIAGVPLGKTSTVNNWKSASIAFNDLATFLGELGKTIIKTNDELESVIDETSERIN